MAADRLALDDEGAKALRRCIDGGRKPGRTGSDDDGVEFAISVQLGIDAEGSGELGLGRIYQDALPPGDRIAHDRNRGTSAVGRMLADQLLARRRCSVMKNVGNAVSCQQVAQVVSSLRPALGYDRDLASVPGTGARPFAEELGERAVKLFVRLAGRLHDVIVEVVPGHARVDCGGDIRIAPVAPADQQRPLGEGLDLADLVKQVATVHVRQGLIGEHHCHLDTQLGESPHRLQRARRRVKRSDRIVAAVAVGQRRREPLQRPRVIVNHHERRELTCPPWVLHLVRFAQRCDGCDSRRWY